MGIGPFRVLRLRHFVVGQTVLQRAFAELGQVTQTRQDDIGCDAVQLCRATGDAIKFLDGQLQRAILVRMVAKQRSESADWKNRLHSSLAEGVFVTDNYGTP